jgi:hypothetical protein
MRAMGYERVDCVMMTYDSGLTMIHMRKYIKDSPYPPFSLSLTVRRIERYLTL